MGSHFAYSSNMMIPPAIKVSIPSEMKSVDNFVVNVPSLVLERIKVALGMSGNLGISMNVEEGLDNLIDTFVEAFELFGCDMGVEDARMYGEDFSFPLDEINKDVERLKSFDYSLSAFAKDNFDGCINDRLNVSRVEELEAYDSIASKNDEDWQRLKNIAKEGIKMTLPSPFVPTSKPKSLRNTYVRVKGAIHKTLWGYRNKGFCLILPSEEVEKVTDVLHYSDMHWVLKQQAPEGRTIADVSACQDGKYALNSEYVKEIGIKEFGELKHPTIKDIILMILLAAEILNVELKNGEILIMFKLDIKDAFMRFWLHFLSVSYVCFALADSLTMIFLTGFFGWTSFPQCWGIVTRLLVKVANLNGIPYLLGYVDDFSGCCLQRDVQLKINKFKLFVEILFGKGSIADKKTTFGRKVVHIGWLIDLDKGPINPDGIPTGTVTMSRRNLLKLLHGFFSIPADFIMDRNEIEKFASWMSRYSCVVFPQLHPFSSILFKEIAGLKRNVPKKLSDDAVNAILIWRCFLCLLVLLPDDFCRPLVHFKDIDPSIVLNFDASYKGIGIRLFFLQGNNKLECFKIIFVSLSENLFKFSKNRDSGFQNAVEFLAVCIGLFKLVQLGFRDTSVFLEGDSMSALCWSSTRSFRTGPSFLGACSQMLIAQKFNVIISGSFKHLSVREDVVANYDCDWISRSSLEDVSIRYPDSIISSQFSDPWINEVLEVINPESVYGNTASLCTCWKNIDRLVDQVALLKVSNDSIPYSSFDVSSLQLFVSGPDSKVPPFTWRGSTGSTVGSFQTFLSEKFSSFNLSPKDFYFPRYKRFLSNYDPDKLMSEFFENADSVELKLSMLGGAMKRKASLENDAPDPFEEFLLQAADLVKNSYILSPQNDPSDFSPTIFVSNENRLEMRSFDPSSSSISFDDFLNSYECKVSIPSSFVSSVAVESISSNLALSFLSDPGVSITKTLPSSVLPIRTPILSLTGGERGRDEGKTCDQIADALLMLNRPSNNTISFDCSNSESFIKEAFKQESWLCEGDMDNLLTIKGIENSTKYNYDRSWHFWPDFLLGRSQIEFLFLKNLSDRGKRLLVALFIIWLNNFKGCSENKVATILSSIRNVFIKAGIDISPLSDPLSSLTKKTFQGSARDSSIKRLESSNTKLPATFEFLTAIKSWKDECGRHLRAGDQSRRLCTYVASKFCFNFATRFSNVGHVKINSDKHAIRRKDVVFEDISGRRFKIPDYVSFLKLEGIWPTLQSVLDRIVVIVIFIHSSKVRKKVGRVEVLGRRSPEEVLFLEELATWILFLCNLGVDDASEIKYDGDSLLFSRRYTNNNKRFYTAKLSRSDICVAIKYAAVSLGLNPALYSSHSWKKASITVMMLNGEKDEVIRSLGDHAPNSASTFLYQHSSGREARPLLFASESNGLTIRDLHLTCPLSEVPYDSLSPSFNIQPLAEIEDTSPVILNEAGFNEESDFLNISDSDSSGSDSDSDAEDE
jgi:hypothetical protein